MASVTLSEKQRLLKQRLPEFLKVAQICERLGVSVTSVHRWCEQGLAHTTSGRRGDVHVHRDDLIQFLSDRGKLAYLEKLREYNLLHLVAVGLHEAFAHHLRSDLGAGGSMVTLDSVKTPSLGLELGWQLHLQQPSVLLWDADANRLDTQLLGAVRERLPRCSLVLLTATELKLAGQYDWLVEVRKPVQPAALADLLWGQLLRNRQED